MPDPAFVAFGFASRRGPGRSENQDSSGVFPREGGAIRRARYERLFLVADGMGGHRGGREASQMVVHLVEEHFFAKSSDRSVETLGRALETANGRIFERSHTEAELHGMGSTCVALLLKGRHAFVAHVGDSRVARIRDGVVEQLTTDHSKVQELVQQDVITLEEAEQHGERHLLTRAIGVRPEVEVDLLGPLTLAADDRFVLCSDGLIAIGDEELAAIVESRRPQEASDTLIQLTTERGGRDDATVYVVHVRYLPGALTRWWQSLRGQAPVHVLMVVALLGLLGLVLLAV